MAKKKTEKAEPEAAPAETEGTTSKADAVRAALKEGHDSPEEGVKFIKEKFGLDIPNQMFSSYKSLEKKKAGGTTRTRSVSTGHGHGHGHAGTPAELARQVKALVEAHGADAVIEMTRVFAE